MYYMKLLSSATVPTLRCVLMEIVVTTHAGACLLPAVTDSAVVACVLNSERETDRGYRKQDARCLYNVQLIDYIW